MQECRAFSFMRRRRYTLRQHGGKMASGAGKLAWYALLLGIFTFPGAGIDSANAASRACRQLETELASASSGGRASPMQIRKYDSAIARQGAEIAKARSRARSSGCGFSLFGSNVAACATLNASMERMNANLDTLRSQRTKLATGGSRRDRARIMAALDARGCRGAKQVEARTPEKKTATQRLLDDFSNNNARQAETVDTASEQDGELDLGPPAELTFERAPHPQGEFRTMCVRTCDGYFFPMSNAASLRDFERDQKNCESSCPGTRMQVFYTRGIGDDPANMTSSVNGKPYGELPTAYLYKKPSNPEAPACGCNAPQNFEIIGGNAPASMRQSEPESASITSFVAVPAADSAPASKPEDLADKDAAAPEMDEPSPLSAADRKVRVVAPAFLPDPKAAIDLRVQDRKPIP
jgi:hypothetical protein